MKKFLVVVIVISMFMFASCGGNTKKTEIKSDSTKVEKCDTVKKIDTVKTVKAESGIIGATGVTEKKKSDKK